MPNSNIPNPGTQVDPSERTIDGEQNLDAEGMSADAEEQDGTRLDEADDSGSVIVE